jgi:hypothetical protein
LPDGLHALDHGPVRLHAVEHSGDFLSIQAVASGVESQSRDIFKLQISGPIPPFQPSHLAAANRAFTVIEQSESTIHGNSPQNTELAVVPDDPVSQR